jgi:regulator of protease activity HflC (stomatin/prohibitin superfamily)
MAWMQTIRVKLNERVVLFKDGVPCRALGPGKTRIFGSGYTEQRFQVDSILLIALPEVVSMLPEEWFREVTLSSYERGVLYRYGRPVQYLTPGLYRYWVIDPTVKLEVFDTREPFPAWSSELKKVVPVGEYVEATIGPEERGVLLAAGQATELLKPSVYRFWNTAERPCSIEKVDLRENELAVSGQELMTRDKVTLRLSLSLAFAIQDVLLSRQVANVRDMLYVAAQLAIREYVASVTLEQLLEGREAMTEALGSQVKPRAESMGVRLIKLGVKDIILPGEMKTLLNRVIEAEKEAQANVILRREETAATRSLANTAKVMAQEPVLLRLKELEAMKEIAAQIQEVRVYVGPEGLKALIPPQVLGIPKGSGAS